MNTKQITFILLLLIFCNNLLAQKKFKVIAKETGTWRDLYCFVDEKGKIFRQLDTAKYYMCFTTDAYMYFAIFSMKGGKGWAAINADEKVLFKVFNTSPGEPSPDYLTENKIRIVDENKRIGFANHKGAIIIKPQFEIASAFHKGKAIIGQQCKQVPWSEHTKESDCHHYSTVCGQNGYINEKGNVLKIGNYTFEQIRKQLGWKADQE